MIPVAKKARAYLRFPWKGKLCQFTCLPFGLVSSPRIVTKCLKPLLIYLRALGVHLLAYLDDILIMAPTKEQYLEQAQLIVGLLEKLGYVINQEKSVTGPTQRLELFGFSIDIVETKFFLPGKKILKIQNLAEKFLSEQISARQLGNPSSYKNCSFIFLKSPERPFEGSNSSEEKQRYWTAIPLSMESRGELMWRKNWLILSTMGNIKKKEPIG